ncbi:TPA: hypothetical protein ACFRHE_000101 [Neisseria lactamica]
MEINLMLSHLINKNLNTIAGCIVIMFGICFALLITEAQQEGKLGYKTDNRERVQRIFSEIPTMVEPYQVSDSNSFTRGPTTFVTFYVKGSDSELKKLTLLIDRRQSLLGFVNACRNGESLIYEYKLVTEFDKTVKIDSLAIEWKYPDSSCN